MKLLLTVIATGAILVGPNASAAGHDHYGESARKVASEIHCKNFRHTGSGIYNKDGGVCWVKGKRVNVLTFRGPGRQRAWNDLARYGFDSGFHWANGRGAVVVAKNGNRPAAVIGARRLPGVVKHG